MSKLLQPSTVREMKPVQAAWVGAMVEGEGSLGIKQENRTQGIYRRPYLSAVNTSVETIATLLRFIGDGTVHLASNGVNYPVWAYQLVKKRSLVQLLPQILLYLTEKQDKAMDILDFLDGEK